MAINKDLLKKEITNLLTPCFGEGIKRHLEEQYEAKEIEILLGVAYRMLSGYMGEKNAKIVLEKLLKKYPEVKFSNSLNSGEPNG